MPRSTVGAPGKDTATFYSDISHLNMSSSNEPPITSSDSTTDETHDRAARRAATLIRNERRADKRNFGDADVSDDEVVSDDDPNYEEHDDLIIDDKFVKLQNLSPDDFKAALNFSINRAAEAGFAAASHSSSKEAPISAIKSSTVFNRYATVFKVADKVSGDEIPRQEIPDCIWKLIQVRVPLILPCITTRALQFIHSNPTSIKTTKSADGVSQSKELMLDMSAFGDPEDISQTDWQDAWINRLIIIKRTSEKDIYKYFKSHQHFISQQEDFTEEFEAYKHFDIWFCRHYTNTRFKLTQQQYQAKVLKFKLKFSHSHFPATSFSQPLSFRNSSQSQRPSTRYDPYPRNSTTSTTSFPKGSTMNAPLGQCLICGRSGHKGSVCSYSHTEKGNRVASCWRNGRVVLISSGAEVCFQWNVCSECKSNHRTSDHFCSVCAAKDHSLISRKCL
jgi:hypothetical protein